MCWDKARLFLLLYNGYVQVVKTKVAGRANGTVRNLALHLCGSHVHCGALVPVQAADFNAGRTKD